MPDHDLPAARSGPIRDAWRLARGWFHAEPLVAGGLVAAALGLILGQIAVEAVGV